MKNYTLDWKEYAKTAREAAAEGCVLLRNEGNALPLVPGDTAAVFGRIQLNYYKSGTGSGGMVNVPYVRSIPDGLREFEPQGIHLYEPLYSRYQEWAKEHPFDRGNGWGTEPWCQEEMPLSDEVVTDAAAHCGIALIILGRTAGEDRDNAPKPGSYYLTDGEREMLQKVCGAFSRTAVILNVGNIIDMSWVEEYRLPAVLYVWQGGMEGGAGAADVLCGAVSPSGKLPDTIARELSDYPSTRCFGSDTANCYEEDIYVGYRYFETFAPERVLWPFGYGLSYTDFAIKAKLQTEAFSVNVKPESEGRITGAAAQDGDFTLKITASVRNTGSRPGKEVVQVYACPPQGKLGKPVRNLCAFAKTRTLAPGEEETLTLCVPASELASCDDSGCTGHRSCFVLEAGEYRIYVGSDVRSAAYTGSFYIEETLVTARLEEALAPVTPFRRIRPEVQASSGESHFGENGRSGGSVTAAASVDSPAESGGSGEIRQPGIGKSAAAGSDEFKRQAEDTAASAASDTSDKANSGESGKPGVGIVAAASPVSSVKSGSGETTASFRLACEEVPLRTVSPSERRRASLPECLPYAGDLGFRLSDVMDEKVTMEVFLSQLSDQDLTELVRGEGMCSPKVTPGTAAAFGGVTERLQSFGIPAGCCSDGPSGIRMDCGTSAFGLPNGTLLAATFNTELVTRLFTMEGLELYANRIDSLLGPGINIHRNPQNGRNFEYHSEDPYLTGRIAQAQLAGMDTYGVSGTVKHFCANNQEHHRHLLDSIVSERALREIYLKPFEMAVKDGHTRSVMTSYGAVNGIWTAGSYDLNTTILRKEWGYTGLVMTDWWAQINDEGCAPDRKNLAGMVRAQNDVYMVTQNAQNYKDNLRESLEAGTLTRAELTRCAGNICRFLLASPAMQRIRNIYSPVSFRNEPENLSLPVGDELESFLIGEDTVISLNGHDSGAGSSFLLGLTFEQEGTYDFALTASARGSALAQMTVTISLDGTVLHTYSWHGNAASETVSCEKQVRGATHYLKFFFTQSGLNPEKLEIRLREKLEQ